MKQTKERTKWTAVALDPPPRRTALPWQQPHALPQPSPCQRHLMSACTHRNTLTYIHTSTQTRRKDTHRHKTCHTSLDFSDWSRRCVCVCVSFISVCLSISPSSNQCRCMQSVCIWATEEHCTHTLHFAHQCQLVKDTKKVKNMSVNALKQPLHTLFLWDGAQD